MFGKLDFQSKIKQASVIVFILSLLSIVSALMVQRAGFFESNFENDQTVNTITTNTSEQRQADYASFKSKQLKALNNDLLVMFVGKESSNDRQVICRNGKIGREQVAIGYIQIASLDKTELDMLVQNFGETAFAFSRGQKAAEDTADGYTQFVYYGTDPGVAEIANVSDFEGKITSIPEQQFVERINPVSNLFIDLSIDDKELNNYVDSVNIYLQKVHDFEVIDWPFSEFLLQNGEVTNAPEMYRIAVPSELREEVINIYRQIEENLLFVKTDYGIYKTVMVGNGQSINYEAIPIWNIDLLGFTPEQVNNSRFIQVDPSAELLELAKVGNFNNRFFYFLDTEDNNAVAVYSLRGNSWYSTLEELGDFCNE